jgi:hypothetical protein
MIWGGFSYIFLKKTIVKSYIKWHIYLMYNDFSKAILEIIPRPLKKPSRLAMAFMRWH